MSVIPDETVLSDLHERRRWLDELKAAQRVGADNLVVVKSQSSATTDFGVTIAAGGLATFSVTFTATLQDYPFTTLDLLFYRDSAGSIYVPRARIEERLVSTPKVTTWNITLDNDDDFNARTFYVKRIVSSTDSGVIS